MTRSDPSTSVESRLTTLERQVAWWRLATVCALGLLALGGTMALRRPVPGPLETNSLTLLTARGRSVTLSLRPSGELEARFGRGSASEALGVRGTGLVLVDPQGRDVARLGEPSARQLTPQ
jgi:hypothetical protein